ncbi:hypothetical protein KR009_011213 [Drosophila setifemur]|nr:hypothetical protein KR009_011213 [Drosophila setifemur]
MLPLNMCRTCAVQTGGLIPMSTCLERDANKSFYDVLLELTQIDPLQESLDDNLPQRMCSDCLEKLKSAYAFVEQARKVNGQLRSLLRECLDETPIDIPQEQPIKTEVDIDYEQRDNNNRGAGILKPDVDEESLELKWQPKSDSDVNDREAFSDEYVFTYYTFISYTLIYFLHRDEVGEKPYQLRRSSRKVKQPAESDNEETNPSGPSPMKRRRGRPPGKAKSLSLTSDGRHACEVCGKSFSWFRDMQRHARSHFEKDSYVCSTCGKGFLRKDKYVFHLRCHERRAAKQEALQLGNEWRFAERLYSSGRLKRIECKLCNLKCQRLEELRKHLTSHNDLESLVSLNQDSDVVREHFPGLPCDVEHIKQQVVADISQGELEKYASVTNFNGYELGLSDSDEESSLEEPKYHCIVCKETFTRKHRLVRHTLEEHAQTQEPQLPWKRCSFCKIGFLCPEVYNQHLRHQCHSKLKKYRCRRCPGKFMWPENLERHACSHRREQGKTISCSLCDTLLPSLAQLRAHLITHQHDLKGIDPEHRSSFFLAFYPEGLDCTPSELSARIAEDFDVQDFERYYNASTFSGRELDLFDSETDESLGEESKKTYECLVCGKTSSRLLVLLQHQKSFHSEELAPLPCTCENCGDGFVCDALLQQHRRRCCARKHNRFHCQSCSLHFVWQSNYEQHLRTHHDREEDQEQTEAGQGSRQATKLQCDECEKVFIWHKDLTRHKRMHQPQSSARYECPQCKRKFHRKDGLKSHMRVHSVDQETEPPTRGDQKVPSVLAQLSRPHGCKQIQCMICLSRHSKIADLRNHLSSHQFGVSFPEERDIANASKLLYPELAAPLDREKLSERVMTDVENGYDLDRFTCIANEAGLELTLESSETDTESEQEEELLSQSYSCNLCSMEVKRKHQLYAHHLEEHKWVDAPLTCSHCQIRFLNETLLEHHSRTNCRNPQKRFQCRKCPLRFRWRENLKLHTNVSHQQEGNAAGEDLPQAEGECQPLQCAECQRSFKMQKDLTRHTLMHAQDSSIYRCRWCARRFYRWANLLQHIVRHGIRANQLPYAEALLDAYGHPGGQKIVECRVCQVSFPTIAALRLHLETMPMGSHHELNSLQNYSVTNQMGYELTLEDSETDEEGVKPPGCPAFYTCGMCQLRCVRKFELQQHQQAMHRLEKIPQGCNQCIFKSVCPELIDHHKKTQCGNQEKQFTCTRCGYRFMWESNLLQHMQLQHAKQEDPEQEALQDATDEQASQVFQCGLCPRKYNRKDRLTAHVKKFHGPNVVKTPNPAPASDPPKEPKRFLCAFCGKAVSSSSNLIIHMRRHTGEKPFKCDYCSMAFPRSSDLQCHRRTHTGERPHVCTVCQKGFARSYKLQQHMRIHSGERPYKCTYCEKSFTQSNDLTLHIRRHTGERPYQCGVCGERFIQGTALKNHRLQQGHLEEGAPGSGEPARRSVLEQFTV